MDQVAQVREKTDIVGVISEYLPLKKSGRNFTTNCPFHNEKTPSFVISPERQIWHCFGCQKGGDAFTFLMEYENIEFPEALSMLAKKAGIELVREKFASGVSSKKERLYAVNHLASEFFHFVLTKHTAGKKALSYLENRGVTPALMKTYMIGFAPSGNALSSYLLKKKQYAVEDLIDAGLGYTRGREVVDFFKERIIFPLIDQRGNVVGFSGRLLGNATSAKYINTRDTLVYHKGSHFFGIHSAKEEIKKQERAILVEGEFDVISCFKEGIKNVVAVKGTALTENQVTLLARFAQKVSLCFDMDEAGQQAVVRSLPLLEKKGMTTTVIVIQNGKDADEAIQKNAFEFKQAIKHEVGVYDFLLADFCKKYDKTSAEGKKKIAEIFLPLLNLVSNEIVKEHYVRKVSEELSTSYESIVKELTRLEKKNIQQEVGSSFATRTKKSRSELLEEYLVSLLLQYKNTQEIPAFLQTILDTIHFEIPAYQKILTQLLSYYVSGINQPIEEFAKTLPKELITTFDVCYLFPLPRFSDNETQLKEIKNVISDLKNISIQNQIKTIGVQMKEENTNKEELENRLSLLVSQLRK